MTSESKSVFNSRIEAKHVQRDEVEKFYQLVNDGKAILGIDEDEMKVLIDDLNNDVVEKSNNMVIEMILDSVEKYTNDSKLKGILKTINVATILSDNSFLGRAYGKYYDDSYYIEIVSDIEKRIILLADILAVLFMYNERLVILEKLLLDELLEANLERFRENNVYVQSFNEVQIKMMKIEEIMGNSKFSDKYVSYSREIYEVALATLVGHEIGHHYLGHTNDVVKKCDEAKVQEFDADIFAINFAIDFLNSSYNNKYEIHQLVGVYLPIIITICYYNDVHEETSKHPSIMKRLKKIKGKLKEKIDKNEYIEVDNSINKLLEIVDFKSLII